MAIGTNPTLSLQVSAPGAIAQFREMATAAAALRTELAALQGTSTGASGITRLNAEVNELKAGLRTAHATIETLQKQVEQGSAAAIRTVKAEEAAVKAKAATEKRAAAEVAAAKKKAAAEVSDHETYLQKVKLNSALMAGRDYIAGGTARQSLGQSRDYQTYLENHRAEMSARAAGVLQVRAELEKEARERRAGLTQIAAQNEYARRITADEIAARRSGLRQVAAEVENGRRVRAAEAAVRREGITYAQASAENDRRTLREEMAWRKLGLQQIAAQAEDERRTRAAANAAELAQRRGAVEARQAQSAVERSQRAKELADNAAANGTTRSIARGAAAAGGGLFLTYGQNIPALAATFGAGMAIKESIQSGAEFEKQMAFVQIASGEAKESIKGVSAAVLEMAGKASFAPVEMASGLRILAQAGFNTHDAMTALTPVMQLAVLGETEVGLAAETAAGLMHAFGKEAKDVASIGDTMVKAANLSQTNISEMSQAMRQASTVSKEFNVSVEETGAMLAVLAQRNIRGSAAGTALMNMFRELDPHTARARRAFEQLGIKVEDTATGQLKPIIPLMQEFAREFNKMSQVDQSRAANDMFNNRAAKGFLNIMYEAEGQLPRFYKEIMAANGYMAESFGTLAETTSNTWDRLKSAFSASLIKAFNGEELIGVMNRLNKAVSDPAFISGITSLVSGFGSLTAFIVENGKELGIAAGAYFTFKTMIPAIGEGIVGLITSVSATAGASALVTAGGGLAMLRKSGGMIGMAFFGGWVLGDFLGRIEGIRGAIANAMESLDEMGFGGSLIRNGDKELGELNAKIALTNKLVDREREAGRGPRDGYGGSPIFKQAFDDRNKAILARVKLFKEMGLNADGTTNRKATVPRVDPYEVDGFQGSVSSNRGVATRPYDKLKPEEEAHKRAIIEANMARIRMTLAADEAGMKASQAILDAKHRAGLVSEQDYNEQLDMLVTGRLGAQRDAVDKEVAEVQRQIGALKIKAVGTAEASRLEQLQSRLTILAIEARSAAETRGIRLDGDRQKRFRENAAAVAEYRVELEKVTETLELGRRKEREKIEDALRPESDRVGAAARLGVEQAYLPQEIKLRKDIAGLVATGNEYDMMKAQQLLLQLDLLDQQVGKQSDIADTEARANRERQRSFSYGWSEAYRKYSEDATNAAQSARDMFGAATRGMEDAIVKFSTTGKLSFRDFANTVIQELIRIQARKAAAGFLGFVGDLIGGVATGGFGNTAAAATLGGGLGTTPFSEQSAMLAAQVRHSGGMLNESGPTRMVHASVFDGATRFHRGGVIGRNEQAIIGEKGEGMFTPAQMRALAPVSRVSGGDVTITVQVNVDGGASVSTNAGPDMRELGSKMAEVARGVIQQERRPHGLLAGVRD